MFRSIFRRLFPHTLASLTAGFDRTINDLKAVAQRARDARDFHAMKAEFHDAKADDHHDEAQQADTFKTNLETLLGRTGAEVAGPSPTT